MSLNLNTSTNIMFYLIPRVIEIESHAVLLFGTEAQRVFKCLQFLALNRINLSQLLVANPCFSREFGDTEISAFWINVASQNVTKLSETQCLRKCSFASWGIDCRCWAEDLWLQSPPPAPKVRLQLVSTRFLTAVPIPYPIPIVSRPYRPYNLLICNSMVQEMYWHKMLSLFFRKLYVSVIFTIMQLWVGREWQLMPHQSIVHHTLLKAIISGHQAFKTITNQLQLLVSLSLLHCT